MKSDNKTQNTKPMETTPNTINQKDLYNRHFNDEQKQEVFNEIIPRLISGESIMNILNSDKQRFPTIVTFFKWLSNSPQMQTIYKYAREVQSHTLFDELLIIANGEDNSEDSVVKIQRDRLRTDVIKFYIAKVLPKVYGEKVDITSNGEALNIVSLGVGIAPAPAQEQQYIDITEGTEQLE